MTAVLIEIVATSECYTVVLFQGWTEAPAKLGRNKVVTGLADLDPESSGGADAEVSLFGRLFGNDLQGSRWNLAGPVRLVAFPGGEKTATLVGRKATVGDARLNIRSPDQGGRQPVINIAALMTWDRWWMGGCWYRVSCDIGDMLSGRSCLSRALRLGPKGITVKVYSYRLVSTSQ